MYEEGASAIEVGVNEVDSLLEELEFQKESELLLQTATESKSKAHGRHGPNQKRGNWVFGHGRNYAKNTY